MSVALLSRESAARTWLSLLGLIAIGLLIWRAVVNLRTGLLAVGYPFQLDYGEGIVWQQALLIPGPRMYGDITHYPFIVFHYPPVYHLAVRAMASLGLSMLAAGRLVSLLSCLGIAALGAVIAFSATRGGQAERRLAGALAGLFVLASSVAESWAFVMRVDMLAICLDFAGIALALRAWRRPWLLWPAILCFTAAVFTKQTALFAPLATILVLLIATPRRAIGAMAFGLAVSLALLALLEWLTGGGFLRHIVLYNVNRFSFAILRANAAILLAQGGYVVLAAVGLGLGWSRVDAGVASRPPRRLRENPALLSLRVIAAYWALSAASLLLMAKSGSSTNYAAEFLCVSSILAGMAVSGAITAGGRDPTGRQLGMLGATLIILIVCAQAAKPVYALAYALTDEAEAGDLAGVEARMRAAGKPVLSDDMVLILQAGKSVPWEPAIFNELAAVGRWDERLIVARIDAGDFAFVYTSGCSGDFVYDTRFSPAVRAAIELHYPVIERHGRFCLHSQAGP